MSEARGQKFRQAAFGYLLVGLLYESSVWVIWRNGLLPGTRGPVFLWLLLGAGIVALVVRLLWQKRNPWIPRVIFGLHSLRLPTLIGGAFFPAGDARIPPAFYGAALVVVLVNLWLLARAGWDL
ncbi:MAG: hypothetical protein ACRERX_17445 [Pseudomonas sp.]